MTMLGTLPADVGGSPPTKASAPKQDRLEHATPTNAFTVDVEDYFQVEAFKSIVDRDSWENMPTRVVANTERALDLLESASVHATFFVLGWIAERHPSLVRRIQARGHEVASHGYGHQVAYRQTPQEFRDDVRRAKVILEDCTGQRIRGFRAPTFSIRQANWWAYEVLSEEGYEYSSSINPIAHDLYGMPGAPRTPFRPLAHQPFVEIPVATTVVFGRNCPCGGGGYFRLMPYAISRWCIQRANQSEGLACVFYCHPWEFDPGQPRFTQAAAKSRIRHYLNLGLMESRIARLLRDFSWASIEHVYFQSARATARTAISWTP